MLKDLFRSERRHVDRILCLDAKALDSILKNAHEEGSHIVGAPALLEADTRARLAKTLTSSPPPSTPMLCDLEP